MSTDNDKEELEDEIVPVGEGVEENTEEQENEDLEAHEEEEEERLGSSDEEDPDDRTELRAKRKEERKSRRQRQKEARDRDQKEISYLRTDNKRLDQDNNLLTGRVDALESRVGRGETSQIDGRIAKISADIKLADQVIAKAITSGQGDDVVEAQTIRDGFRDNLNQLRQAKQAMAQRAQPRTQVDPTLVSHAQKWMTSNSWWDPNNSDDDSAIVSALDNRLAQEGLDARTPEYWKELDKRVRERLPHRFENEEEESTNGKEQRRGGGPSFRTGGRERPLKPNEVYISPERKTAMVEAGVWEDPVLRQRYLKQYATYDQENRT